MTRRTRGGSPGQRYWARAKAVLVGRPLASEEEATERLSKKKALAIFSSDAISSSAYATEEIVRVLVLGGTAALFFSVEVALAVAILLALVAFSYRQVGLRLPQRRRLVLRSRSRTSAGTPRSSLPRRCSSTTS